MKTKLTKDVKFRTGEIWEKGTEVIITVKENLPTVAIISKVNNPGVIKRLRSYQLHNWFSQFVKVTDQDIEDAMMDSVCSSLTGYNVEPDGWDHKGFPSILLAYGLI